MEKFYKRNLTYSDSKKLYKKINKILIKYDLELCDLLHLNYLCQNLLEDLANDHISDESLKLLNFLSINKNYFILDNFR